MEDHCPGLLGAVQGACSVLVADLPFSAMAMPPGIDDYCPSEDWQLQR